MLSPIVPVFVSSTWLDLQPEHGAVARALHTLRETKYVGMKYFGSRDETTRQASLDEVDHSLAYVGIIAGRYGSGITEAEYDRATERGLPRFIYFKDDAAITDKWPETDPAQTAKLDAFKQKLRANHLEGFDFKSPEDLAAKVTADLHRWLFDEYLTPKFQDALRDQLPRDEAQSLLDAVRDFGELSRDLLTQLRGKGFNISVAGDFVAGDKIIYNTPPVPLPTLHQLRAPVGDFVGREKEIDELLATLRRGGSAAITGISGMGGIGKTELAFYVAERLRETYPDAQLVLDMRGTDDAPRDPADALAACARAFLGLEYRPPDDLGELTQLYRSILQDKRALILLDNAYDSAQVRSLLPPPGSALLITSRNAVTLPGMRTRVTLDQLQPGEARELLTGIAPHVPENVADQICFLCGYLPLAIRAAGSLLDVTADLDPTDYAAQLGDERTRLERIGTEGVDINVEASFNLSYARLSTDAARVFRQLAVFPATFDAAAGEAVCEDPGHKHLSDLLRRSLVLYNPDTRRYRLHDLARLFADSWLDEEERSASQTRHATHYLTLLGVCNDFYSRGGEAIKSGLALFDMEQRNIILGQKWACDNSGRGGAAPGLCNRYPAVGVYVLDLRQHPREQVRWVEAALAAARQLKDSAAEGRHLGQLGLSYTDLGEIDRAIECSEQALIILRAVGDKRNEGGVLGNLSIAYMVLGETRRAIELCERQLEIAREVGDRRVELNALGNLGVAYRRLGEVRRAIESYEQCLVIAREIGDPRGEGSALGNLGTAYADLGELRRAAEFFEQRITIAREISDRLGEGYALFNIGVMLSQLGDRGQAISYVEAALNIFEERESPNAESVRAALTLLRGEATEGE